MKPNRCQRCSAVLVLAGLMICLGAAEAADKPATGTEHPQEQVIGPQVDLLLRQMGDYLKSAKEFSVHVDALYDDLLASGQKIQLAASDDISVRRPDRFRVRYRTDMGGKRFWYDGKTFTLLDEAHGTYAVEQTPAGIDATLDYLIGRLGFTPPLSDLLYSDPYATLKQHVVFGFQAGMSDVEGTPCHHLAFVGKNVDWQLWIEDGKLPLPRKLVITYKTLPGAPQYMAVLSDWDFATHLPDSAFSAVIPPKADRIGFLKAAVSAGQERAKKAP
ncbi:DUF2092 domain-containing protein [Methylococcus capsulatus]|uniref:DUF2092 domain-containing protein n=1 Tax=Methylococcus capsulatus TaxID=414 RepID=A0AA35V2N8_METCP|nr:DUF2092 domain-containing protein [Methylococcus capsulatus]CAI8767850.1 conserved exported protein of unknown function [Methylococcus capsulatus]